MGMDPAQKLCTDAAGTPRMEKWVLRKAFDTPDDPYLPHDVLWRQKEQFSDGVGKWHAVCVVPILAATLTLLL
jgi:asparagine synthase (glutamine-hydrolysing)